MSGTSRLHSRLIDDVVRSDAQTRTVRFWGDSITEGVSNPTAEQSAYRGMFFDLVRLGGDDVRPLGSRLGWGVSNTANQGLTRWPSGISRHEGVSGNTIAQVTARVAAGVAAELARTGSPCDIEFVMVGTNDMAGGAAAALVAIATLIDTLRVANPTGYIVVCSIPRVPTAAAARTTFNAGLSAVVATKDSRVLYLDTCSDFTRVDMGTYAAAEDAHPSRQGLQRIARKMYDRFRLLWPLRFGLPSPRRFQPRIGQSSLSLAAGANGVKRIGGAFESAIETSGTSWLVGINVYMATLPASAWGAICGYGSPYNTGGFMIAVYGGSTGTAGLYGTGSASSLVSAQYAVAAATWHRMWAHYDGTSGYEVLSFWGTPAGRPVLFGSVSGALSFASAGWKNLFMGYGGTSNAPACLLDNAVYCAGTGVPRFDEVLPALEDEYFEGRSLPGSLASFVTESTGTGYTDAHGGSAATVWSGSAVFTTQAHGWDG